MGHATPQRKGHSMYGRLALMLVASFISMYILMYAMVDTFKDAIQIPIKDIWQPS